jgi:cell division septation protein DedD
MNVAQYIKELLYTHECVIVPDLGGFLAQYKGADLNTETNIITPPCRQVSYNARLVNNDGLLCNYIANATSATYSQAQSALQHWVRTAKALLLQKDTIHISGVGTLQQDELGAITFNPDSTNFLIESYGMQAIHALPVAKQPDIIREVKPIEYNTNRTHTFKQIRQVKRRSRVFKYGTVVAALLLVIGLGIFQLIQHNGFNGQTANQATVIPAIDTQPQALETLPEATTPIVEEAIPAIDTTTIAAIAPESTPVEAVQSTPAPAENNNLSASPESGYYIIIGAFSQQKNIDAAISQIKQDNPTAAIYQRTKGNMQVIGYKASANYFEALRMLHQAQESDSDRWLKTVK